MNYILFLAMFITIFGIISLMFDPIMDVKDRDNDSLEDQISLLSWVTEIPIIGKFLGLFTMSIQFIFINEYVALIYATFFGIPLAYILLRLIKGGG